MAVKELRANHLGQERLEFFEFMVKDWWEKGCCMRRNSRVLSFFVSLITISFLVCPP